MSSKAARVYWGAALVGGAIVFSGALLTSMALGGHDLALVPLAQLILVLGLGISLTNQIYALVLFGSAPPLWR
jgi:hypothetical protein